MIAVISKNEMEMAVSEQFLNQKQLARRWGLSPRTLERWRCQGRGPHYLKLVGRVCYRLSDVEAFEAAQSCAGGSKSVVSRPGNRTNFANGTRQPAAALHIAA